MDFALDLIPRIKLLNPDVASKIAAGEVVERPASVLKELLENSLDAGASKIDVTVEQGGIQSITVIDNGCGILQQDLQLALQQHATSKIYNEEDLASITSLGFRGEALASINSVAKLSVTSQTAEQEHAWNISGTYLSPAAHPIGTTIKMQDLFYNVPARRKFLRSSRTEYLHLEEVFRRIALSHFNVAFSLTHNSKLIKSLSACKDQTSMARRLSNLCGKQLLQNSLTIDAEQNGLRIWGWLGAVDSARSQEPHQYFFINKRVIKDRLINHAIRQVYQPLCLEGKMPFYCLYLELDPIALDVNVHPTKHEVRFRDARVIHAFLTQVLTSALTQSSELHKQATGTKLPIHELSKNSALQTANTPVEVLSIVEQKIIIARLANDLIAVDILRAQQELLVQALCSKPELNILEVPITVTMHNAFDLNADFAFWCKQIGIELTMLGPTKIVMRSLPLPLCKHNIDFATLLAKLYILWRKGSTHSEILTTIISAIKFAAISQLDAQKLVAEVLNLPSSNIYRILNAEIFQTFLQTSSQKAYQT